MQTYIEFINELVLELHNSTEHLIDVCSSEDYTSRLRAYNKEHGNRTKGYSFEMPQYAQNALERYTAAYERIKDHKSRNTLTLQEIRSLGMKGVLWDSVK